MVILNCPLKFLGRFYPFLIGVFNLLVYFIVLMPAIYIISVLHLKNDCSGNFPTIRDLYQRIRMN